MPTPIPYKEALRAMKHDRLEADNSRAHGSRAIYMRAPEREKLGALVISYLSPIAEIREHPTAGIELVLPTSHGPLVVHYSIGGGDIFQRFETPGYWAANPHSGKWNFHHDRKDNSQEAFENWRLQVEPLITKG